MNVRMLSVALGALSLLATGAVYAQDPAAPAPARRAQGQRQGQNGPRTPRVQVCTMKLEALKTPKDAFKSDFQGAPVLFCCADCKAAFEKLDDAGKTKAVKKATLTGRKLTYLKQLEAVEKELKDMDAPAVEKTDKL